MTEMVLQLFYFTNPILQHQVTHPNISLQYCTLLWQVSHTALITLKAFLRGIYIGFSSLENKDAIAGK